MYARFSSYLYVEVQILKFLQAAGCFCGLCCWSHAEKLARFGGKYASTDAFCVNWRPPVLPASAGRGGGRRRWGHGRDGDCVNDNVITVRRALETSQVGQSEERRLYDGTDGCRRLGTRDGDETPARRRGQGGQEDESGRMGRAHLRRQRRICRGQV